MPLVLRDEEINSRSARGMDRVVAGRIVDAVEQGLGIPVQPILAGRGDEARQ